MKYKTKEYAKALADIISKEPSQSEQTKIVKNFLDFLKKNNDEKKAKEIIAMAQSMHLKKSGKRKVTIETARKINAKELIKPFLKDGDVVEEKINKELIAGIKIIVNSEAQLDFSMLRKINNLF